MIHMKTMMIGISIMNYYDKHAKEYINKTKDVDMKEYYSILSFI